jgi:MEDS: MEthanogen/methylotroph, DcmR Sensory domain
MLVADDPRADLWPQWLIDSGQLIVASTSEVYGTDRRVVAEAQRDTFAAALHDALREGYSGMRVAADNTSLTSGAEPQEGWNRWEEMADRFMAENPVTGLCGFDRTRSEPAVLAGLRRLHAVSVSD